MVLRIILHETANNWVLNILFSFCNSNVILLDDSSSSKKKTFFIQSELC